MNTITDTMKNIYNTQKYFLFIFSVFAFFVLILPSSVNAATIIKPTNNLSLVGYWSFNDGTGTKATDFSGNGNTGTLTNMAAPGTATSGWGVGKLGGGLNFDGTDDYVTTTNSSSFDFGSGDFAISWWEYRTSNANNKAAIIRNSTAAYTPFLLGFSSGGANLLIYMTSSNSAWDIASGKSLGAVTLNTWNHFVVTRSGNTFTAYKNGVQTDTWTSALSLANGSGPLLIGGPYGSTVFNGSIDEVRVYRRALTSAQVISLYNSNAVKLSLSKNSTGTSLDSGLIGLWSFDSKDISGSTAYDRSGSGNNGTLNGSPVPIAGRIGQGLNLNGTNNYMSIPSFSAVNGQSKLTISTWIKRTSNTSYGAIFDKKDSINSWINMQIHSSGFIYMIPSDYSGGYANIITPPASSDWKHYVMVFDGTQTGNVNRLKLYINGVQQVLGFVGTIPATTASPAATAYVGFDSLNTTYINGSIDDTRIYNRALSASEVLALYNVGSASGARLNISKNTTGTTLDNGLAALWSFDGRDISGTTVYDRSGNGNNGTLTNSPIPAVGKMGQALQFNESNTYVTVPDSASLQLTSAFTLSAWVYFTGSNGNIDTILMKNNSNTNYYGMYLFGNRAWWYAPSPTAATNVNTIPANTWKHVVMTFDSSLASNNVKIYLDGAFDNAVTKTGAYGSNAGATLSIGRDPVNGRYFGGKIDDVRIYNRALSASEVQALYNLGK